MTHKWYTRQALAQSKQAIQESYQIFHPSKLFSFRNISTFKTKQHRCSNIDYKYKDSMNVLILKGNCHMSVASDNVFIAALKPNIHHGIRGGGWHYVN